MRFKRSFLQLQDGMTIRTPPFSLLRNLLEAPRGEAYSMIIPTSMSGGRFSRCRITYSNV